MKSLCAMGNVSRFWCSQVGLENKRQMDGIEGIFTNTDTPKFTSCSKIWSFQKLLELSQGMSVKHNVQIQTAFLHD
jgi:hypothetical protein